MARRLGAAGVATPELDARLLAAHALGLDTNRFIAAERDELTGDQAEAIGVLVERRLAGEPVARVVGRQEFYGLDFALNEATLVPRPETELLVDLGRDFLKARSAPRILDLGTGTGCIAISVLAHHADATAVATDISARALELARENARAHGVAGRLELVEGSWFEAVPPADRFDLIVTNPPYIARPVLAGLVPEVRDHDPRRALDGGTDGLDAYRAILGAAPGFLAPDGQVLLEIGYDQAAAVALICRQSGLDEVESHPDLARQDRVIVAQR